MKTAITALALLLLAASAPDCALAGAHACTVAQDDLASQRLQGAKSLTEIYEISNAFPGCMEGGGMVEEVSDDVVVRLARRWDLSIAEVYRRRSDAAFVAFVLQNINETASGDDLKRIVSHASSACPAQSKAICGRIEKAAKEALSQ